MTQNNEVEILKEEERILKEEHRAHRDWLLPASILIAALMISGSIFYLVKSGTVQPKTPAVADQGAGAPNAANGDVSKIGERDAILGDPNASVTVVEYADFQCPYCERFFSDAGTKIREQYVKTGKVKMIYRDFSFLGPESTASAEAAECAKDQGKFWAYHDAIYNTEAVDAKENNGNLNRSLFLGLAKNLKLDTDAFTSCMDSNKYTSVVTKSTTDAQALGVSSTPTIFVNGQKILGAQPFSVFQAAIDQALAGK
jgi:protein-disulfide isomerase